MSYTPISVTVPVQITDAMLVSTDVLENDHPAYVATTTYAQGDRVIVVAEHAIYESLQSSNLGKTPATSPAWWKRVSPTNRWKVFDTSNTTKTVKPNAMTFTLRIPQAVNTLGLLAMQGATSARVRQTHASAGTFFDQTFDLTPLPSAPDWYEWAFGLRSPRTQLVVSNLTTYPGSDLIIDVTGTTELGLGVITVGQERRFGKGARYGARLGIQDYSRKDTNEYGDITLLRRSFARKASFDTVIPNHDLDWVYEMLSDLRSTPALWSVYGPYSSTIVYGFYKDFEIMIPYAVESECSIELEGLT